MRALYQITNVVAIFNSIAVISKAVFWSHVMWAWWARYISYLWSPHMTLYEISFLHGINRETSWHSSHIYTVGSWVALPMLYIYTIQLCYSIVYSVIVWPSRMVPTGILIRAPLWHSRSLQELQWNIDLHMPNANVGKGYLMRMLTAEKSNGKILSSTTPLCIQFRE